MIGWIAAGSMLAAVGADGPWRPTPFQTLGRAEPLEIGFKGGAWSTNRADWNTPEHEEAMRQIWAALQGMIPIHIVSYNTSAFDGSDRDLPRYTKGGRTVGNKIPEVVVIRGPVINAHYRQKKLVNIDVSIARGSLFDPAHGHARVPWMRQGGEELISRLDADIQATHIPFSDWAYEHAPKSPHLHEPGDNLRNLWAVTGYTSRSLPFGDKSPDYLYTNWPEKKDWFRYALQEIGRGIEQTQMKAYTNDNTLRRRMKHMHKELDPSTFVGRG